MATAQSNQIVAAAGDRGWDQLGPQNFQWVETYLIHLEKAERTVLEGRADYCSGSSLMDLLEPVQT